MKKLTLLILPFFLAGCGESKPIEVNDFDTCIAAGNPVMESYPRKCRHENKIYQEVIEVKL